MIEDEHKATVLNSNWQTFFLLVKGNIGPGCLALPYSFSMLGTHGSLPFLFVIAVLCIGNMWLLVECKQKVADAKTYGELGLYAFGRGGELIIEIFLTLSQLSICCVYMSFISNGIAPLFGIDQRIIILLLVVPVATISQFRHMRDLAPLSIVASALLVCALSIIGYVCLHNLTVHGEPEEMPVFDSSKIILFLVSTVYAFEGIGIILPIEGSMRHPEKFTPILAVSMILVTFIYIAFGEVVIMAFGSVDDAGITKYLVTVGSVPANLAAVISVLVSVAVLLSYPLQLYPALQVLEIYSGLATDDEVVPLPHQSHSSPRNSTVTCDSVQQYFTQLMNKLSGAFARLNFMNGRDEDVAVTYQSPEFKRKRKPRRMFSYQAVAQSFDDHELSRQTVSAQSNTLSEAGLKLPHNFRKCQSMSELELQKFRASQDSNISDGTDLSEEMDFDASEPDIFDSSPPAGSEPPLQKKSIEYAPGDIFFIRSLLRCVLVVCTALVAAFVPNIGLLVSLAGATSGTSLALIFPPLLDVCISRQQRVEVSYPRSVFCGISIAVGIVGALVGTALSLSDIYNHVNDH